MPLNNYYQTTEVDIFTIVAAVQLLVTTITIGILNLGYMNILLPNDEFHEILVI